MTYEWEAKPCGCGHVAHDDDSCPAFDCPCQKTYVREE